MNRALSAPRHLAFQLGLTLVALATASALGYGADWIIDDDGGPDVDFLQIQPAILIASPGDRLLIREGIYAGFVIDGKALTLVGTGPGNIRVNSSVTIRNLPFGTGVQLENLVYGFSNASLNLMDNSGPVWFQDCTVHGRYGDEPGGPGGVAVSITSCDEVGFVRCTVLGGSGGAGFDYGLGWDGGPGGEGVRSFNSILQFFDTEVRGGNGGPSDGDLDPGPGARGLRALGASRVFLSRSSLQGGVHGDTSPDQCTQALFQDGPSVVRHFESTFSDSTCSPGQVPPSVSSSDTTAYCFGSYASCPCNNLGLGAAGCGTAGGISGELSLSGSASVSDDSITLRHTGLPVGRPLLYFQGSLALGGGSGVPLSDGLLCAGGAILRLATRISNGGEDSFGHEVGTDPSVSFRGQVPAVGGTRFYQVWYRAPNARCAAGDFNFSNGIEIPWRP